MLVNLKEILAPAYEKHYAVGSFNCYSYETFRGCIAAGEEMGAPVIAAFGAAYLANMSLETAHAIAASLAREADVPVCLHLDHCVSIGTVHGLYKGEPYIRTDILEEIHRAVDVPLVLHGGSGTPEEDLHACIARGIAKINVNTEISSAVVAQTTQLLTREKPHYSTLSLRQVDYVKTVVKKYIELFECR